MEITFDYDNERRSVIIDDREVSLIEILLCLEKQTQNINHVNLENGK